MSDYKTIIKSNYKNAKDVLDDITKIETEFARKFKRNMNSALLYSSSGTVKKPRIDLVMYYQQEDKQEIEIVKNILDQKS